LTTRRLVQQRLKFNNFRVAWGFPRVMPMPVRPETLPYREVIVFIEPLRETHIFAVLAQMNRAEAAFDIVGKNVRNVFVSFEFAACLHCFAYVINDVGGLVAVQATNDDFGMLKPHIEPGRVGKPFPLFL
jgi:hypothetical protein